MLEIRKLLKISGVALALGMFTTGANAATIDVFNDWEATPQVQRGSVNCDLACEVMTFDGTTWGFSSAYGELDDGPPNSSEAAEAVWLSMVTGDTYVAADLSKTDPASDSTDYSTIALYTILKIGLDPDYTVIKNTSGVQLTWSWTNLAGGGGGLSHFSSVTVVPLPAGLPLLLSALGFGAILRRKAR